MSETTEPDELSVEARRVIEELRLDKIEIFCRYFLAVHAKVPDDLDSLIETMQLAESMYDLVDGDRETKELGVDVYVLLVGVLQSREELGLANDHIDIDVCNLGGLDGGFNSIVQQIIAQPPSSLAWIAEIQRQHDKRTTGFKKHRKKQKQEVFERNALINLRMDELEASGIESHNLVSKYIGRYKPSLSRRALRRIRRSRDQYRDDP